MNENHLEVFVIRVTFSIDGETGRRWTTAKIYNKVDKGIMPDEVEVRGAMDIADGLIREQYKAILQEEEND